MAKPKERTPEETQQMILDILDGRVVPVKKHVSRNSNKFHDVKSHVRKVPDPFKEFRKPIK